MSAGELPSLKEDFWSLFVRRYTDNYSDRKLGAGINYLSWKWNFNTLIVRAHVLRPQKQKSNIRRVQESRCDNHIPAAKDSNGRISVRRSANNTENQIWYRYRTRACFFTRCKHNPTFFYAFLALRYSTSPIFPSNFATSTERVRVLRRRKQEPTSKSERELKRTPPQY